MKEAGSVAPSPGHWVVVTTSFPAEPGDASGHFVATEVNELRKLGHRVTVIAPRTSRKPPSDPHVRWLRAGDAFGWPGALARLKQRPTRVFGIMRFALAARRELERLGDAERVIVHFVVPGAWPIAARRPRPPLEVVAHGSDVRLIERLPQSVRRLIAKSLAGAEVRCVSHELRGRLERALTPLTNVHLRVTPAMLDVDGVPPRARAREALGVAPETRLFVVIARLVPSKRVEVALRAAALVRAAHVVVLGDGPESTRLRALFPDVSFLGRVARPTALTWIAAADVVLSASLLEGAPSVVREARALGVPVVALAAGDLRAWSLRDPELYVLEGSA